MRTLSTLSRRRFLQAGASAAAAACLAPTAAAARPTAATGGTGACRATQYGPVRGCAEDRLLRWYGVPYAAALRWQPPHSPTSWTDTRDCTRPGPVACQYAAGPVGTEDCLRLDITAPAGAKGLPVLVYLHGGGNQTGSARELDGGLLAEAAGCVVVSVDHRLGVFGFNALPALCSGPDATGNFALLDILCALDWVRENIASFGGDPGQVTLCGFSSGGRNVLALLASPLAAGRFQRAVCLSGGPVLAQPGPSAQRFAAAFAPLAVRDGLFATESTAQDWLLTDCDAVRDWLRGLGPAQLCPLMAGASLRMSAFPHLYADGVALPAQGFAAAPAARVPLLLLTGTGEFDLFAALDPAFDALPEAQRPAARQWAARYGSALWRQFNGPYAAETLASRLGAPIYLGQVAYGSPASRTPLPGPGSFHGVCLPMLTARNRYAACADCSGAGYREMGAAFRRCLAQFLRTGSPNGPALSTTWPAWTPGAPQGLVLDAGAHHAALEVQHIPSSREVFLAQRDADGRLSAAAKELVLRRVLGGRWFSAAPDGAGVLSGI